MGSNSPIGFNYSGSGIALSEPAAKYPERDVTIPNGTYSGKKIKGVIVNRSTFIPPYPPYEKRPPEGSVVHTDDGDYMVIDGKGEKVTKKKAKIPGIPWSDNVPIYIDTYHRSHLIGHLPLPNGSIVETDSGNYVKVKEGISVKVADYSLNTENETTREVQKRLDALGYLGQNGNRLVGVNGYYNGRYSIQTEYALNTFKTVAIDKGKLDSTKRSVSSIVLGTLFWDQAPNNIKKDEVVPLETGIREEILEGVFIDSVDLHGSLSCNHYKDWDYSWYQSNKIKCTGQAKTCSRNGIIYDVYLLDVTGVSNGPLFTVSKTFEIFDKKTTPEIILEASKAIIEVYIKKAADAVLLYVIPLAEIFPYELLEDKLFENKTMLEGSQFKINFTAIQSVSYIYVIEHSDPNPDGSLVLTSNKVDLKVWYDFYFKNRDGKPARKTAELYKEFKADHYRNITDAIDLYSNGRIGVFDYVSSAPIQDFKGDIIYTYDFWNSLAGPGVLLLLG